MAEEFNHFPEISAALHKALSQTVRKTAFDLQANAASNAPVDTGFLRNSIYAVTTTKSTYGRAVQVAKAPKASKSGTISRRKLQNYVKRRDRQRKQEAMLLPEVERPANDLTAYVAVGANYGIYLEMGTRHMPAQPYFYPAVDATRPGFEAALGAIEAKLKGAAS